MSRGFLVGMLWGLLVSAAGLVLLSVVVPPVTVKASVAASEGAVEAPAVGAESGAEGTGGADPVTEAAAAETAVGTVDLAVTPQALEAEAAEAAAVEAAGAKAAADVALAAPEVAPKLAPAADSVLAMTAPDAALAAAPTGDAAPEVTGAKPAVPAAPASDLAPSPDAGTMPAPKQDKLLDPPAPPPAPLAEPAPQMPGAETISGLPQVPVAPGGVAPDQVTAEQVAPDALTPDQMTLPKVVLDPAGPGSEPSTLAPDVGLGTVAGVTTDRLPRIGDAAQATVEEVLVLDPALGQPMLSYARAFVAEPGKPKFAILLRDIGAAGMARDDLARLPFAVTFVIDPAAPDAAEAAHAYRAAGQEVMILASGLPEGATPADLEQSFQAMALALPETVAVLDMAAGGLQENRLLATQAIPILKAQGRGIVTYDRGLGAAEQVATREGLAHAVIFRELDADGEDSPVIRRYLDRAAFKAAQEGQVLVIGQTRPETVAALLEWMVEGRGSSVQLAPVTAVMQAN